MADKRANIILSIQDFASKGIGNVAAKVAILRQGFLAMASVVKSAISIFQDIVGEYAKQETAVQKLNIALKNQGIVSQAVTKDLVDFAGQMQKNTTYADDTILEMEALLTTFNLTGDAMKTTLKASADLASGLGIDLRSATLLLGKAALGETSTLSRYGMIIDENIPKAQKFQEALRQVQTRFGGSAEAATNTYAGRVAQLTNNFGDLKETIALYLLPSMNATIDVLKSSIAWWDKLLSVTEEQSKETLNYSQINKASLEESIAKDKATIAVLEKAKKDSLFGLNKMSEESLAKAKKDYFDHTKALIRLEKEHGKELAEVKAQEVIAKKQVAEVDLAALKKAEEEKKKLVEAAEEKIANYRNTEEQLAIIRENAMADELIKKGEHGLAIELLEAGQADRERIAREKVVALDKEAGEKRAANFKSTMGKIATMSNSSNKTLAVLGKTAAVTQATMDTYAAANVALRSAPPPFNFALAALVTAAGMANVAQISGVKLAEGGMLMPRSGGVSAVMAEAGKAEVAIPLDDERTKEKLRDTLGGGGNTIVIQAGTIVADDYSVGEFAKKIDEKLFELQRNGRSYR